MTYEGLTPAAVRDALHTLKEAYERCGDDFDIAFITKGSGTGTITTSVNIQNVLSDAIELLGEVPEKGRWMEKDRLFDSCTAACSICNERTKAFQEDTPGGYHYWFPNYCPHCGSKMSSVEYKGNE